MNKMTTVEISKNGELKIPKDFMVDLQFKPGTKVIILESRSDLLLKRLEEPSLNESFNRLASQTRKEIRKKGLTKKDLAIAIEKVRAKN